MGPPTARLHAPHPHGSFRRRRGGHPARPHEDPHVTAYPRSGTGPSARARRMTLFVTPDDPGGAPMTEYTPSQAEGDRDDDMSTDPAGTRPLSDPPRTTPSQAEGEREDEADEER